MAVGKLKIETTNDTKAAEQSIDRLRYKAKAANAEEKKDGINFVKELKQKNEEAIKGMIGMLSPVVLIIAIIAGLAKAFTSLYQHGKKLRETAADIGVSAVSMADLDARAKAAGLSTEEFRTKLDELKAGKTTLEDIKKEMGGIGDKAKYAARMTRNLIALSANRVGENMSTVVGNLGDWLTLQWAQHTSWKRNARMANIAHPAMEVAVAAGMAKDKAIEYAGKRYNTMLGIQWTSTSETDRAELGQIYDAIKRRNEKENYKSESRMMVKMLEDLDNDMDAAYAAYTRRHSSITMEEFMRRVTEAKEETPYDEDIRRGKEKLKEKEAENKRQEELDKRDAAIAKTAVSNAYTAGGGLIAGLTYAINGQTLGEKQLAEMVKQAKAAEKANATLVKVHQALTGEE